jgi:hypothetical protein
MSNVKTIRPRTLPEAYSYARMNDSCPNCGALPGDWCQRPDGHYRRIRCLKRMPRPNPKPIQPQCINPVTEVTQPPALERK